MNATSLRSSCPTQQHSYISNGSSCAVVTTRFCDNCTMMASGLQKAVHAIDQSGLRIPELRHSSSNPQHICFYLATRYRVRVQVRTSRSGKCILRTTCTRTRPGTRRWCCCSKMAHNRQVRISRLLRCCSNVCVHSRSCTGPPI